MNKRTRVNFDKHELHVVDTDDVKIHHLKIPGSSQHNIKFINVGGIMAVAGDYGNWIFCREFIPSGKEKVDAQYMTEKLRISSSQEPYEFDNEATIKEIQEMINSREYTREEDLDYLTKLLIKAQGNGEEYHHWAFDNCPSDMFDSIPYHKDIKYWLKAVYDGFDEVCNRLKK